MLVDTNQSRSYRSNYRCNACSPLRQLPSRIRLKTYWHLGASRTELSMVSKLLQKSLPVLPSFLTSLQIHRLNTAIWHLGILVYLINNYLMKHLFDVTTNCNLMFSKLIHVARMFFNKSGPVKSSIRILLGLFRFFKEVISPLRFR